MEPASTVFKEERDPYYIKGFHKGKIKASCEAAIKLILATELTDESIATFTGATISFVRKRRRALKKRKTIKE